MRFGAENTLMFSALLIYKEERVIMKEKLIRFMIGRYGMDQFSRFLMWTTLVIMVIGTFTHPIVYCVGFVGMIYMYFRIFSKNWTKRSAENQWYLRKSYAIRTWFNKKKKLWKLKKTHKIFKCPTCKQKIKVPKGKGKIEIRCTKCDTKFIKRS